MDKSFAFAVRIVRLYKLLCSRNEFVLSRQLLRSGTSVGAMLKESDKKGELTFPMVRMLLEKEKPVERKVVIKTERINSYFPDTYSTDDIEKIIFQLLDNWKNTQ